MKAHLWSMGRLCLVVAALALAWGNAGAQTAFGTRYSNTAVAGDIVLIGNVNYHCAVAAPASNAQITACNTARTAGNTSVNNGGVYMAPVDTDSNAATTNSSSATLSLPAGSTVLFAGLYWGGISASAPNRAGVLLTSPLGVSTAVTAASTSNIGNNYQSYANVTGPVSAGGVGAYSVGNVASTAGANTWAGWTLVVAYRNPAQPTRNLAVFDGYLQANNAATPVDITVGGFLTPGTGAVRSTIGVVTYDGDAGQAEGASATPPGSMRFGPNAASLSTVSNTVNPVNDVFNSSISATTGTAGGGAHVTTGRAPSYTNTLGVDIDTFTPNTPLPNGATSAVVRVIGTGGDVLYPGVITLATEIFVPNLKDALTKTVTDVNGGALVPGDVLEYELTVRNSGNDGALSVVLTDPIPANTTYLPGSLAVTLINAGAKTDAAGDDVAEYDAAGGRVVARLGTGATASAGGSLLPGQETHLLFRVTVNAGTPGDTVLSNIGTVTYRQQTLGNTVSDTSDSDPVAAGDQPSLITVAGPNLRVDKFHTGTLVPGVPEAFTLRVSNAGPAPTFGTVSVQDTLPAGLTASAIAGPGWTCTLATLTCTRADALSAGASYPDVAVTASGPSGSYTNTATVSGGGEGASATGDNSDADPVVVAPLPALSVSKTVRNVTTGAAAVTANTARPGDVLEYCVTYNNAGGDAPGAALQDPLHAALLPLTGAYGAGLGLKWTVGAGTTLLTSAPDADAGSLAGQLLTLNLGTLGAGAGGTLCFQARVR